MTYKEKHNSCLLSICDNDDVIIRVVEIDIKDVNLMKQSITQIYENQTGGITIRLKIKTSYTL
jgi:hypothetical protein